MPGNADGDYEAERREIAPRLGIVALNILQPGLGLLRLSRSRMAFGFLLSQFALAGLLLAFYAVALPMTFAKYIGVVGSAAVAIAVIYLGSMWKSWRYGALVDPHPPWWSRWYGLLLIWAVSVAVAWPLGDTLHAYYRGFYAPAASMAPTIGINDCFLGDMRPKVVRRGDVVIVRGGPVEYVKRVAAIPGDRIEIRRGIVILNGHAVEQSLVGSMSADGERMTIRTERFPGEARSHRIQDAGDTIIDDAPEVKLGADRYYVLGDNRDRSADSRLDPAQGGLGVVGRAQIVGKALFIYWRSGEGLSGRGL